jgi:hypothetical protein
MSRDLASLVLSEEGVFYRAEEQAGPFLNNLKASYLQKLRARAEWVSTTFDSIGSNELDKVINSLFSAWTTQFQPMEFSTKEETSE